MHKQIGRVGYVPTTQNVYSRKDSVLKVMYDAEQVQGDPYFIRTNVRTRIYITKVRVVVFKITDNLYSVRTAVAPCTLRYVEEFGLEIAKINNPLVVELVLLNKVDSKFIVH